MIKEMSTMLRASAGLGLLLSVCLWVLPAQALESGRWQGEIQLPGQALAIEVQLIQDAQGRWSGQIDIPAQQARQVALKDLLITSDSARFVSTGVPGEPTFQGSLSAEGKRLSGTFSQGGGRFPFVLSLASPVHTIQQIETLRNTVRSLQGQWKTPGLAVAIVHKDQVLLAEGFGLRDLAAQTPVTPVTRFAIGSATKAFTATALSMLVDEGQLRWDTPLQRYLPDFRLQDPLASQAVTPLDLLTHRSGLPRHDLAWYGSGRSRQELYASLEALAPSAPFRSQFQYQNLMYLTAGHLLESVSGQSWERFVQKRLLSPLGMVRSHTSLAAVLADPDHATPYRFQAEKPTALAHRNLESVGPAGSLYASATDMAQWLRFQLGNGSWEGRALLQPETLKLQHSPQIVVESGGRFSEMPLTLYGLGWFVSPYRGQMLVQHGGNIDGFSALVAMLPGEQAGVAILANRDADGLPMALALTLLDQLSAQTPIDWSARLMPPASAAESPLKPLPRVAGTQPSHGLDSYTGSFGNGGYGALQITRAGRVLQLQLGQQRADLEHWHYDSFRVKQPEGPLHGQMLRFETDTLGEIATASLSLEPSTPAIVFARQAEARLKQPNVLAAYVGSYHLPPLLLKIWREGDKLVAQASGQPKLVLDPLRPDWFQVHDLPGYYLRFERVNGRPERIWVIQPNGMLSGQRLAETPKD